MHREEHGSNHKTSSPYHARNSGSDLTLLGCTPEETQDLYSRHFLTSVFLRSPSSECSERSPRRTMPQRSLHPLVYVLLIWTSIVTIILFVFITLFFTPGQFSNSSTVGHTSPLHNTPSTSEVLNLQAEVSDGPQSIINWTIIQTESSLISKDKGHTLKFTKDGNYILNHQVTLSPCGEEPVLNKAHSVTLKLNGIEKLVGWTDTKSNSTGLLSRIFRLAAGTTLVISIDPGACVNTSVANTHLDIVWLY